MSNAPPPTQLLEALAKVLLRCTIFGFALLLVWFGVYMLADELVYRLHGGMFGLSKHEVDVIFYCGMVLVKLIVLLFFLAPWLAIRLVLGKTKAQRAPEATADAAAMAPAATAHEERGLVKQQAQN